MCNYLVVLHLQNNAVLISLGSSDGSANLTIHLYLVPRLENTEAVPLYSSQMPSWPAQTNWPHIFTIKFYLRVLTLVYVTMSSFM
jgi:hypothetical protein